MTARKERRLARVAPKGKDWTAVRSGVSGRTPTDIDKTKGVEYFFQFDDKRAEIEAALSPPPSFFSAFWRHAEKTPRSFLLVKPATVAEFYNCVLSNPYFMPLKAVQRNKNPHKYS
jgi:hypothetical protein